jgi:hypothetical protein
VSSLSLDQLTRPWCVAGVGVELVSGSTAGRVPPTRARPVVVIGALLSRVGLCEAQDYEDKIQLTTENVTYRAISVSLA